MITIICGEEFLRNFNAWQYSDPRADDYVDVVDRMIGPKKSFTVYYEREPVCGRVVS